MPVLKYYDGSDWEPVVSALQGPTGDPGAVYQDSEPTDTGVLWVDTDDDGFLVVPNGGVTGSVLTKQSSADYDTGWNLPTSPGLVHIDTQTASAVSSFSFSNVFDTGKSYMINFSGRGSLTTDQNFLARVRNNTTDDTGNIYFNSFVVNGTGSTAQATSATITKVSDINNQGQFSFYLLNKGQFSWFATGSGYRNTGFSTTAGGVASGTPFDGITFFPASGTITGTFYLYEIRTV
jgi:hypothetical protein